MRFRSWRVPLAALVFAAGASFAAPDAVRDGIRAALQANMPDVSPADYARGAAAADSELAAQVDQHEADAQALAERGRALWQHKFKDKRSLANCFPNGGRRIVGAYPQYDPRLKRVVTLEMAVNQCLKAHHEKLLETADPQTMGLVLAYLRSLSDGRKVAVRVPGAAEKSFEQGRRLYFTRMGQRNFACASCHIQGAGKRYGDKMLSPVVGQATHMPLIRGGKAMTLQARMRECLEIMGAAPFAAGSDELNDLEYFVTYLSNGLPLKANAWRP